MKNFVLAIIFILGLMSGYIVYASVDKPLSPAVQKKTITPTPTPFPTPILYPPQRLIIEKLGIDAPIEHVGLDKEGKMDVPQNADNVGWFQLGYIPGQKGNAVLAGHLDRATGAPAIFYTLSQLTVGDKVTIVDQYERLLTFQVFEIHSYPVDEFPSDLIFGQDENKILNLITCQGTWDSSSQNYSNRFTVRAKLIQ